MPKIFLNILDFFCCFSYFDTKERERTYVKPKFTLSNPNITRRI